MPNFTHQIRLHSEAETIEFANALADQLTSSDVLLLSGDIGAGKTYLARHILLSLLDQPEDIPSPTFTLVQSYDTALGEVLHADLYRLSAPHDVDELGLFDAFGESLCLIEWPDRLGPDCPSFALDIVLKATDREGERQIELSGARAIWEARLQKVLHDRKV